MRRSVQLSCRQCQFMMRSFPPSYCHILHLFIAALLECKAQTEKPCGHVHHLNMIYAQSRNVSISCLTTTHPLQSLTVKLSRINPNKVLLPYSEPSPASEPQRWSVREDAGNVTLHLIDVRSSDEGLYDCQIYKDSDCLNEIQFKLTKCKTLNSVYAQPDSSVLLPCAHHPLPDTTDRVTWEVITDKQSTQIDKYSHIFKPSNSTEKHPDPLYMRAKPQNNGSLLIMKATHVDELWYRCTVNEETCYELKLVIKDLTTSTLQTAGTTTCPLGQTEDKTGKSETNVTAVTTSVVTLCLLISLIVGLILLKRRKHKINRQITLNTRFSVYYSQPEEEFNVPLYSMVENNRETMTTFIAGESEASAYKPDDTYEKMPM